MKLERLCKAFCILGIFIFIIIIERCIVPRAAWDNTPLGGLRSVLGWVLYLAQGDLAFGPKAKKERVGEEESFWLL